MEEAIERLSKEPNKAELHYWYLDSKDGIVKAHGNVTGHRKLDDSTFINTSQVVETKFDSDAKEMIIRTLNTEFHCPMEYCKFRKPFKDAHKDQIKLVTSFDWIDFPKLDGLGDEIREIFSAEQAKPYIDEKRCDAIIEMIEQNIECIRKLAQSQPDGKSADRQGNDVMQDVAQGDMIVFDSVSRMSRNAADGIELYMDLYGKGIELVFLKEPHINTSTYKQAINNTVELVGNDIADIIKKVR